jgi:transcriptional regulator GlxA family with amidase domain
MDQNYVRSPEFGAEREFFNWLQDCANKMITVCSVCNGAFALGEAGLLTGTECTTHWRRVSELQLRFPQATVVEDILYVKGKVNTSGGISAGIDLALSILEELAGARFTNKVARGLVVYYRRNGKQKQETSYSNRNHINGKIHDVQDFLDATISAETSFQELALLAGMGPEKLLYEFKEATGITLEEYVTQIRLSAVN